MQSFVTSTRGAFKTALTVGAMALTVAGASLATSAPAEAFVRHGGGFHRGVSHRFGGLGRAHFGGIHRFGYGYGRHLSGYGFRRGVVGDRPFGLHRFAYGIGLPSYGFRRCAIGRHFVPGIGCRLNAVYGHRTFGYDYGVRRIVRPVFGVGYGVPRFGYAFGRHFGGGGDGFRHVGFGGFHRGGFGRGGFRHTGFGHGGHFRRH